MALGRFKSKKKNLASNGREQILFDESEFETSTSDDGEETLMWTMPSGNQVKFTKKHFTHEELTNGCIEITDENLRDQDLLNEETVREIASTLAIQQFVPCIVRKNVDNSYGWLDGSRRLYCARYVVKCGLDALVAEELSKEDAKVLTKALHSQVSINIREKGKPLLKLYEEGMTYIDLMEETGFSKGKVTRCLAAARVPQVLLVPFIDINVFTHADYATLNEVVKDITAYTEKNKKGAPEKFIKMIADLAETKSQELRATQEEDEENEFGIIDLELHAKQLLEYIQEMTLYQVQGPSNTNKNIGGRNKTTTTVLKKFKSKTMKAVMKEAGNKQSFIFTDLEPEISLGLKKVIDDYLQGVEPEETTLEHDTAPLEHERES